MEPPTRDSNRRDSWYPSLLAVGIVTVILLASIDRMWGDTFLNLYAGRWVFEHGIPHTDPFTIHGAGRTWINSQWLGNVVQYGVWTAGGYALVTRMSIGALVLAYGALAVLLRSRGASPLMQVLAPAWALVLGSQLVFPRAQNLVVPLFVGLVWMILDDDARATDRPEGPHRPWRTTAVLVVGLVAWANLHGSSVMAAGLCVAYAAWRLVSGRGARMPYAVLALAAPLCLLATPYGPRLFASHAAVMGNRALQRHTTEWASVLTPIGAVQSIPGAAAAVLLLGIAYRRQARLQAPLLGATVLLGVATLVQARYAVWLGLIESIVLADVFADRRRERPTSPLVTRAMGGAALACGVMAMVLLARTGEEHQLRGAPMKTVDQAYRMVEGDPDATFLGDLDSAAVLLWMHPDVAGRVAFDPRLEVFASQDLERWYRFQDARAEDWFDVVVEDDPDVVMATREWKPRLARQLQRRPGTVVRAGDGVVLLPE